MPVQARTFRVFISSTFEDLGAERDALQRDVFPRLRRSCEQHGARFQAIDLRWGVRDEAARDQKTIEICLREIERCQRTGIKPNFLVLLGRRYGWRPLPSGIDAGEFENVRERIADPGDRALVHAWYRRDDNAVPAAHVLRPRTGEWVERERWQPVESRLHRALLDGALAAGLSEPVLVKYRASATHQEILQGLGTTPEDRRHVFAFCRRVPDADCDPDLVSLRNVLRGREGLPAENFLFYAPGDLEGLCRGVEETLSAVIEREALGFAARPVLDLEVDAHDAFARGRAAVFGRAEVLDEILGHLRGAGREPLILHGASGSGKSAVMAQASERARAAVPSAVVIRRFVGASPESSNGLTLLRDICEQIGLAYGTAGEPPTDFVAVVRALRERLALATAERPLVLFVDALDQLRVDDPGRSLDWLGGSLPEHCHVAVSTTDAVPAASRCRLVDLEALPQADAAEALDHWLDGARRRLQPAQRERVLAAFTRCGLPLYLKLAFELARYWASYEPTEACLLGEGVDGVIDTLLDRLALEANHGPLLVGRALGYLAAARYGLTEDEVIDVLTADEEVWRDFERRARHTPPEQRLPVVVWSRLFLDLEPYLAERSAPGGTVVTFYHRQLAEQAAARFLGNGHGRQRHAALAAYFGSQPLWLDAAQRRPNARKGSELVHQLHGAEQVSDASETLTDVLFVASKCAAGLVFDLQVDYSMTIGLLPEARTELEEKRQQRERVERWTKGVMEHSFRLAAEPGLPLPEVPRSARLWSDEQIAAERRRYSENPSRLDRLRSFERFVQGECASLLQLGWRPGFVVQHAYNHAPAGPVHAHAERSVDSVPLQLMLRRWSPAEAYNPRPAVQRTLEVGAQVTTLSMTPDGARAVCSGEDGSLRVWDLDRGQCLRTVEGVGTRPCVTLDGRRAMSGADGRLREWDLDTGSCLRTFGCHGALVGVTADGRRAFLDVGNGTLKVQDLDAGACLQTLEGVGRLSSVTPDGKRALSIVEAVLSADDTLRVWDLETGACLRSLEAPGEVTTAALTADGNMALSGARMSSSHAKRLRVWDLREGLCLRSLEGDPTDLDSYGDVYGVATTPDGRLGVSAGKDALQAWDLETGRCLRTLRGYGNWITGLSVSADGRRVVTREMVSPPGEGVLRVWDLEAGARLESARAHELQVSALAVTPDGRRAVSGSPDGRLCVWDLETGSCLSTAESTPGTDQRIVTTPEGSRAVSKGRGGLLLVWDLAPAKLRRPLDSGFGTLAPILSVAPDGRRVASRVLESVVVWDIETGRRLRELETDSGTNSVTFTPDGRRLVFGDDRSPFAVRVWDVQSARFVHTLPGHGGSVQGVCVAPDGRRAVSASDDGTLRVWDLRTGECLQTLQGYSGGELLLTRDGDLVLAGNSGATTGVWDVRTGVQRHTLQGRCASVTPDGRRAVSRDDRMLRLWNLETGGCLALVQGETAWTAAAAAGASRVVAGSASGSVVVFDLHDAAARALP